MASSQEYLDFIIEQLYIINDVSYRKMMGEYILYYREKIFGGIYDDRFLVKITKASKQLMPEAVEELPYEGAKPMLLVDDVDNKEFLYQLITNMYEELPTPKVKKKKSYK
ncbi:TfoX/Sxy family protein [Clostridium botulinum]|uniref:TfoX/Sxy family protein n=1 Tax=Clostridium botulinum TaxID=1491 RepID=UPI000774A8FE|nr:TfoX/Sxy family protein [Clostridium botulinum]